MRHFDFKNSNHLQTAVCKKTLGHGGFAVVKLFQCKHCHNEVTLEECNKCFVIKELNTNFRCLNKEDMAKKYNFLHKMLLNEYKIGLILNHPNIMKIIDIEEDANLLMLEHIVGIDMLDYLNLNGCNDEGYLLTNFYYVLDALEYMHNIGIAHRDIKLENILLDTVNDSVKLIDFGQSFEFKKNDNYTYSYDICGTEGYFPPEYYNQLEYMPDKVDVWCSGIVLYNLVFDYMPWEYAHRFKDEIYGRCYMYLKDNELEPNTFNPMNYKLKVSENDISIINNIFKGVFNLKPSERITIKEFKELLSQLSICHVESKN